MKIAILGTGVVGRTLAGKLNELGHTVTLGTRDIDETMASDKPGHDGVTTSAWMGENSGVELMAFEDIAQNAELIINCVSGMHSVAAIKQLDADSLSGKTLVDVANPLEFTDDGLRLSVCNDESLAEQIQAAAPDSSVVKTRNTMSAKVMTQPEVLSGHHVVFVPEPSTLLLTIFTALFACARRWRR